MIVVMVNKRLKLPIGIQSFEKLREGNNVYQLLIFKTSFGKGTNNFGH
jgi:hypothetical protein